MDCERTINLFIFCLHNINVNVLYIYYSLIIKGVAMLGTKNKVTLYRGKARRLYYSLLKPSYIKQQLARRKGNCLRCGVCCRLGYSCPSLGSEKEGSTCKTYTIRPTNCRIFPIDNADLRERNLVASETTCGFYFEENPDIPSNDYA